MTWFRVKLEGVVFIDAEHEREASMKVFQAFTMPSEYVRIKEIGEKK